MQFVKPSEEVVVLPTHTVSNPYTGKVFTVQMHHPRVDQACTGDNVGLNIKDLEVILKMSGFTPHSILAIFGPPSQRYPGFTPPDFFVNFGPTPFFQLFEALFRPKRRPEILNFYPTRNFGHFWAALLEMSFFFTREKEKSAEIKWHPHLQQSGGRKANHDAQLHRVTRHPAHVQHRGGRRSGTICPRTAMELKQGKTYALAAEHANRELHLKSHA